MASPETQAERNLVVNGDFTQGLTGWKNGPVNPSYVTTKPEQYEGLLIRILSALDGASAFQEILVPKNASAEARYVLSCLGEMNHKEEGLLELSVDGVSETQKVPLLVGLGRDRNADQLRQEKGQPLVFKPREYEVPVTLPLLDTHTLRVEVCSPRNEAGDYFSSLRITRINLQLHLPAAKLLALKLDDQELPLDRALPLCPGALGSQAHRLTCVHADDCDWQGTRESLSGDIPQDAIVFDPERGKDKPLDDAWRLFIPELDDELPLLFDLWLNSEHSAPARRIQVSLDHHRLKFLDVQEQKHFVILEYNQIMKVGVRVGSYYTDKALARRAVTWTVEGKNVSATTPTDPDGWVYFEHTPDKAGDLRIMASVESPYYASRVVSQVFEVKVLTTDPLKDVLTIVAGAERPWEQPGYPNRGAIYELLIRFPEVLRNTDVTLRWFGEPHDKLGVKVNPELDTAVRVSPEGTVRYQLDNEDKLNGQFSLRLISSHLLEPSPEKPMSLARNVVKPGDVREPDRICVVDENESAWMWMQVLHETALGDGDPVERALVFWRDPDGTVTKSFTGAGGWSRHSYRPLAAGEHPVDATIKAHEEAEPSERTFVVKAIATSLWKQHVKIFLDEYLVDFNTLGLICRHGETHTLKVVPVTGSPWIRTKNISLNWREADPRIGLKMANPGVPFLLMPEGVTWIFTSSADASISSLFQLSLKADGVAEDRELSGRFINPDLTQELSIRFDQGSAALDGQALYPCLGAVHRFNVWLNVLSPLVGLSSALEWSGTPADEFDATVSPPLPGTQPMEADGSSWELDFVSSVTAGQFALTLSLPQLSYVATAKPMLLGHNAVSFNYMLESPVDPVVDQDSAWTCVNVISRFTRTPVAGVPVKWQMTDTPVVVNTDAEGNSCFGFVPASAEIHSVRSSLSSPYDNYTEEKSTAIKPLTDSPWAQVKMSIDGQPQQMWGSRTGFPRRKGVHSIVAFFPKVLEGQVVRLGQTSTAPSELDNYYEPELGAAQVVTGGLARFSLRAGDVKNGSFSLRLSAERLARLSPDNAMSLGPGSQVLKISADSHALRTLAWGETLDWAITLISAASGKPMVGWTVKWSHPDIEGETSVTDYYGVARIKFVPTTPGAALLKASVGDEQRSVWVLLPCFLNDPNEISELLITKPAEHPGELVEAQATVVSAFSSLPTEGATVMWTDHDDALPSSQTDANGKATVRFMLTGSGERALTATVESGLGGWDVKSIPMSVKVGPIIKVLNVSPPVVYSGASIRANLMVVSSDDGGGWAGLTVRGEFQNASIPFTDTDASGYSQSGNILTSGSGIMTLSANLPGHPQFKSFEVEVLGEEVPRLSYLRWNGGSLFSVHVKDGSGDDLEGIWVFFRVGTAKYDPVVTDHIGRAQIQIQEFRGTLYAGIEVGVSKFLHEISIALPG
ncbi:hypothetical protein [Pseudomonas sp. SDO52101_S400]